MSASEIGDAVPLPDELKSVPQAALEDYVIGRIRQFSRVFVAQLLGESSSAHAQVELAYTQAISILRSHQSEHSTEKAVLRFAHGCKFLGCLDKECSLCNNNPNKRCGDNDHFDECYADNQVLKSKCDADVFVKLVSASTGLPANAAGVEVQVFVIDGESVGAGGACRPDGFRELLCSDEGQMLLGSHGSSTKNDGSGRLLLKIQDGSCRLPDIFITDKTDTFHMDCHTYSSFRLVARAFQRDLYGNSVIMENIAPAISEKFIVKTQRALNDYRKSEYPHYKDELTKLKFIGSITAQRLRDIQAHIAADVPFTSIETVEQLKHLMLFADQNRQVENKLLELLNMKGKHRHKWDFLRDILLEKIVYDDVVHRAWFADDSMTQGLLFACKQGQVNMEKPFGIAQRVVQGGQARLQVVSPSDPHSQELMKSWRSMAEEAWSFPGHPGWAVVSEPLELVSMAAVRSASGLTGRNSGPEGMQGIKRESASVQQSMGLQQAAHRGFHPASVAEPQGGMYYQSGALLSSRNSVGSPIDAAPGVFQFTAQRSLRSAGGERLSSGGGTPRSEHSGSIQAMPHPFSRGLGQEAEMERVSSAPSMFSTRPGQEVAQRSALHPFANFASAQGYDLDPNSLRVSSSPDMFVQQGSPGSHPDSPVGHVRSNLGLDLSQSDSPRLRGHPGLSRIRRMSATDASFAQQLQLGQPTLSLDRGAGVDLSVSKRPRASVPVETVDCHDPGMFVDPGFDAGAPMINPRSSQSLYHQESRGRHHPRSRMSFGGPELELGEQRSPASAPPLMPEQTYALDMEDLLVDQGMHHVSPALRHLTAQQQTQHVQTGLRQLSPTQYLSSTMQHTLHLGEDQGGSNLAAAGLFSSHDSCRQPEGSLEESQVGSRRPMVLDTDAVIKAPGRTLKRSESDSFKHMLDVNFLPSPTNMLDHANGAQEFAAFLDDHFSDSLAADKL